MADGLRPQRGAHTGTGRHGGGRGHPRAGAAPADGDRTTGGGAALRRGPCSARRDDREAGARPRCGRGAGPVPRLVGGVSGCRSRAGPGRGAAALPLGGGGPAARSDRAARRRRRHRAGAALVAVHLRPARGGGRRVPRARPRHLPRARRGRAGPVPRRRRRAPRRRAGAGDPRGGGAAARPMSAEAAPFEELVGQAEARAQVEAAARDAHGDPTAAGAMTHAWLITGPPGSGRSNLAYAFASALLSPSGVPDERVRAQVSARTHPDLAVLASDRVTISIDEVRQLVASSQYSPSVARYRVLVLEDADRMTERTSNVLLKALEEPPPRTVWILCARSEADLLPTIRSRVRTVRLRVPDPGEVADLLVRRDGVDRALALRAAEEAQSHIGMAHRLATDEEARRRRDETISIVLDASSVPQAVRAAQRLLDVAKEDAAALTEERDRSERAAALRSLGVESDAAVPVQIRGTLRQLEEDQKRRATRSLRDSVDRVLVDLLSVFRDVLLSQLGADVPLVNVAWRERVEEVAATTSPAATLAVLDAIAAARRRLPADAAPLVALEGLLVTIVLERSRA